MEYKMIVTRRAGQSDFLPDFSKRYANEKGYYSTVADLNTYGITFGSPIFGKRRVIITVEHDFPDDIELVRNAFGIFGIVSDYKPEKKDVAPSSP